MFRKLHQPHATNRAILLEWGIFQCSGDIAGFQIRVIRKDFIVPCPGDQKIEDFLHAHARIANVRPAATW
jgi:hypothetical protein